MKPAVLVRKILQYLNLENELDDFDIIHDSIVKDAVFKGTNLWILMFAIVVASVGLNVNSTAVIIGAMLISPLMGPINGMGYSIATYNSELFRLSLKNFLFAVLVSLVASTAYFAVTPISTAHSELLARTSPTIYDVLIALFGGLAGIVAISSKLKGNVIPGVAIATALMPPLCTAGYGLATAQFDFFFGAIYLFTINTVFIALSSVIISQILKFPIRTLVDARQKNRVNQLISAVIVIVLLPSIYFGYLLVQKERFNYNAQHYVSNVSTFEGHYLLKHSVDPDRKSIELVYGGPTMTDTQKESITGKSADFFRLQPNVHISQGLSFTSKNDESVEVLRLREELDIMAGKLQEREVRLDSIASRSFLGKRILGEIRNFYPQLIACSYSDTYTFRDSLESGERMAVILFGFRGDLRQSEREKISGWLETRLETGGMQVVFEKEGE